MDIVTAFAVLCRRLVFEDVDDDESWLRKLRSSGFSVEDIDAVYSVIKNQDWSAAALAADGQSQFTLKLTNQFYKFTWFSQDSVPGVVHTTLGSLAGSPPADIVFSIAFSRVLLCFSSAVSAAGLSSSLTGHGGPPIPLSTVAYCDDDAFPVVAPAPQLVHKTAEVVCLA